MKENLEGTLLYLCPEGCCPGSFLPALWHTMPRLENGNPDLAVAFGHPGAKV